ncbi:L-xylulose reductase-like [Mobula birostris]|uniref:L-xylulose reductase-like n=1 Tax=Mobula birostris TaxID=1983395 RepID=UPI003B285118
MLHILTESVEQREIILNLCAMELSFAGKRALVTGAGKGIGRATAKALLACGAGVIAVTRTQSDLDSLVQGCPDTLTICVDLSNWEAAENALKDVGPVDLLVNNAAVGILEPFLEVTQEAFDKLFVINVKAVLHVGQCFGQQPCWLFSISVRFLRGRVASLCTMAIISTLANSAFTPACCGNVVLDPMFPLVECVDFVRFRTSELEDVVNAIIFLFSDKSATINGVTLPVDGGYLAS